MVFCTKIGTMLIKEVKLNLRNHNSHVTKTNQHRENLYGKGSIAQTATVMVHCCCFTNCYKFLCQGKRLRNLSVCERTREREGRQRRHSSIFHTFQRCTALWQTGIKKKKNESRILDPTHVLDITCTIMVSVGPPQVGSG
jgi:hypothetical protein